MFHPSSLLRPGIACIAALALPASLVAQDVPPVSEKRPASSPAKASDVKAIKGALLEKDLNGVQLSVFKTDKEGNPIPNHVWIGAINHNKEAMIVTAVVTYSSKKANDIVVNTQSKVALVVSADAVRVIWERDGTDIEVLQIGEIEVK